MFFKVLSQELHPTGLGSRRGLRRGPGPATEWGSRVWDFRRTAVTRFPKALRATVLWELGQFGTCHLRTGRDLQVQPVGHHWWLPFRQPRRSRDLQAAMASHMSPADTNWTPIGHQLDTPVVRPFPMLKRTLRRMLRRRQLSFFGGMKLPSDQAGHILENLMKMSLVSSWFRSFKAPSWLQPCPMWAVWAMSNFSWDVLKHIETLLIFLQRNFHGICQVAHLGTTPLIPIAALLSWPIRSALRQEVAACSGDLVAKDPKLAEQPRSSTGNNGEKTRRCRMEWTNYRTREPHMLSNVKLS